VALAAKLLGIKAVIVMPKNSPIVKVNATRETYGGQVVFCDDTVESRAETTQELIEKHGYVLIHPYDNPNVIAGAGTATLELFDQVGEISMLFAPIGGGGLISGNALAAKGLNPQVKVYGCEPARANDAFRSLKAGQILTNSNPNTIADGLRTNLCERTFKIIQENVSEIVLVSEEQILEAMRFLWERMKLVVEPSGAVPLAGLLTGTIEVADQKVGVILSGGNIDLNDFFTLIRDKIP
jgi:threonine dehydratase